MKNGNADLEPKILYEDDGVLVLNKPAGLVVHADGKSKEKTLTDWLTAHYPRIVSVGEPLELTSGEVIQRPGIVHRIDRDTSGVLIVAKTQSAYDALKAQFQKRTIKKIYDAFVYGKVKKDVGVISSPIGRSKNDFRQFTTAKVRGEMRDAVTHYAVLSRGKNYSHLELVPKTGRTHQIRVHLKSIGHPVIADKLYAPSRPKLLGFTRLALHARVIEFTNIHGKRIIVEAPIPKDFKEAIKKFKKD